MGGTEIYEPLRSAVEKLANHTVKNGVQVNLKKKIFFLTDGEVSSPEIVIDYARIAH